MFGRSRPLRDPVTIYLDGDPIPAERGEPLAAALLASDKTILARSPKLHRPRGPSCLRGACDGCLARVDGVPNVMTCLQPAAGGERIVSQNVIGSRKADLLRVTDWFFAQGIDHHHLMAGVPGLQDVMLTFARKVAGLGRLPADVEAPQPARRIAVDVAVIGGGPSGIVAASRLGAAGKRVLLIDDGLALGGALVGAPHHASELLAAYPLGPVEVLTRSVAAGIYEGEILVATASGEGLLVRPKATILATGAHDGVLVVAGNDLPGVFSARALCRLLSLGLEPDGPVAIVRGDGSGGGEGFWANELARALGHRPSLRVAPDAVAHFKGTGGVRSIGVLENGKTRDHDVVAVGIALPGAPAFELAEQAGAKVRSDPSAGYAVVTDDRGRATRRSEPAAGGAATTRCGDTWATGECTGKPFDLPALRVEAERVAADVLAFLDELG